MYICDFINLPIFKEIRSIGVRAFLENDANNIAV